MDQVTLEKDTSNVLSYVSFYPQPLEVNFLSQKQKEKISQQRQKLDMTKQYAQSIMNNPDLGQNLEKDVLSGSIYSTAESANIASIVRSLQGDGPRVDLQKSAISPTGQFLLLSASACEKLGILADGYFLKSELDPLVEALNEEKIPQAFIDKLVSSASKYGAIVFQRGVYAALKPILEEAVSVETVKESFENYKKGQDSPMPGSAPSKGASLSSLMSRVSQSAQASPKATTPSSVPTQPKPAETAKISTAVPSKDEIKREISTKELPAPEGTDVKAKPIMPQPTRPAPPKPDTSVPQSAMTKNPTLGLPSLNAIDIIDDLKRIEPAHLRQGDLNEQIKAISAKIAHLAVANKVLSVKVAQAFEQSPLFKLYLEIGGKMISHSVNNRKPDYRQVVAELTAEGKQVLSFTEFEAVADLRKELERM